MFRISKSSVCYLLTQLCWFPAQQSVCFVACVPYSKATRHHEHRAQRLLLPSYVIANLFLPFLMPFVPLLVRFCTQKKTSVLNYPYSFKQKMRSCFTLTQNNSFSGGFYAR